MGTYVEDCLESMYMLPSEIKRNFELMRDLDKVCQLDSYPFALVLMPIRFLIHRHPTRFLKTWKVIKKRT